MNRQKHFWLKYAYYILVALTLMNMCHCRRYGTHGSEVVIDPLIVPSPVQVGETVQLDCRFRVGTRGFNALRWFKDGSEIYLFNAGEHRGVDHRAPGINISLESSDKNRLTLTNITPEAQGNYTCEVMSEGPPFVLAKLTKFMAVVDLPETPQLIGLQQSYKNHDVLNVTCQATNGSPAPVITLKLNGKKIQAGRLRELPSIPGRQPGYFSSATELILPITKSLVPTFTLGCYASIYDLEVKLEENILVEEQTLPFFSLFGSGSCLTYNTVNILVMLTSLIVLC